LMGEDYVGDPTRDGMLNLTKTVVGENLLPIWVQSVAWEGGEAAGRTLRGAVEFTGGRAYPEYELSPEQVQWRAYREIEDKVWSQYPRDYRDVSDKSKKLDKYEAKRLLMKYPGVVMAMKRIEQEKGRWLQLNRRMLGGGASA